MKSAEVTDKVIDAIESGEYGFIRCNYPNGDMVGHTGNLDATRIGVEAVDLALARLLPIVKKHDYALIVTADHGNADEMLEKNKRVKSPCVPRTLSTPFLSSSITMIAPSPTALSDFPTWLQRQ